MPGNTIPNNKWLCCRSTHFILFFNRTQWMESCSTSTFTVQIAHFYSHLAGYNKVAMSSNLQPMLRYLWYLRYICWRQEWPCDHLHSSWCLLLFLGSAPFPSISSQHAWFTFPSLLCFAPASVSHALLPVLHAASGGGQKPEGGQEEKNDYAGPFSKACQRNSVSSSTS